LELLEDASLFLDLDGTLLEIAESPRAVLVGQETCDLLHGARERLDGRVAIVTGRSVDDVRAMFPSLEINIAGSHGLEIRWADGRTLAPQRPEALDYVLDRMRRLQAERRDLLIEDKPFGVALHYRRAPQLEAECRHLAESLATETGLPLQPGKMVFELKAAHATKATALITLLAEPPFLARKPVMLGDDINDEPAFRAVNLLGGASIHVGLPQPTAAVWRLNNVAAVRRWLRLGLGMPT